MLADAQVMHTRADAPCSQRVEKLVAANPATLLIDERSVEMMRVAGIRLGIAWKCESGSPEPLLVRVPDLATPDPVRLDTAQLMDSDRGLEIHHVVFEAGRDNVVVLVADIAEPLPRVLRHPVESQHLHSVGKAAVLGDHHSALARRHVLCRVEAETADV